MDVRADIIQEVDRHIELRPIRQSVPGEITVGVDVHMDEGSLPLPPQLELEQLDGGGMRYVLRLFVGV